MNDPLKPAQSRLPPAGLYTPENEHDACGVGLVADLNNRASHAIIEDGLQVLKRLMHRGATGWDPETGDGAGILVAIPDTFFRKHFSDLPERGRYGVGMLFGGEGSEEGIERVVRAEGGVVLAWRDVPCDATQIGPSARESFPRIRQLFVSGEGFSDAAAFERALYVIRQRIEREDPNTYFCSFSCRSVVYKGLLLATQLEAFYGDLADPDFASPLAVVHQRYSTNTFPTWRLAHPFRYLAHNGEINTLRGNLNSLRSREASLASPLFGADLAKLLPLIPEGQSDSASLDNMFELLVAAGRPLDTAMMMLIPQAWGENYHMGRDVRAFFDYHSGIMEPWDGPSAVVFSDGVNAGAILDRNGLRPARYTRCRNGRFVLASETGVLDIDPADVVEKGRLRPGEMVFLDLENGRLLKDAELKNRAARRRPYRRWVEENRLTVHGLFSEITDSRVSERLLENQKRFGYSREDLSIIIREMAATGNEPTGSMGNDAALAVLSEKPQLLFNYFKLLFAQVTNPPIDPIREALVMSLTTYIGNCGNILGEGPEHARLIRLARPILTDDELKRLAEVQNRGFGTRVLPMGFPAGGDGAALGAAIDQLAADAVAGVGDGVRIVILSDRDLPADRLPIPSLLATAAVNRALVQAGVRPQTGLVIQTGEAREVMHFALLLGYGATAVNPYLALETVSGLVASGELAGDPVTAAGHYIHAIDKGLLKTLSKMGISTLRSYRCAQVFEAVGLNRELIDRFLPGTTSRVGGIGLDEIAREAAERGSPDASPLLPEGGHYRYRIRGEHHLWSPESLAAFRQAVQTGDYDRFKDYSRLIDDQAGRLCTLRGLFSFAPTTAIPIEEVESEDAIVRRFVTGAMSLGSISPEAHEAIAEAMNTLGGMSNSGEGGERPERYGTLLNSEIKQIASGRFGVTIHYLRHARDLQIKMAQGAKPGEGGQLPGHKVNEMVAKLRCSVPNVTLISPPPHHDIYSIEDLAQLIYDLRTANPAARVSVKLVAETGVGTIAAGVAKAQADVVLIAGHDGGTGASPLTSIKHAGLPWEIGLAETQQTLVMNRLRNRVKLQVDGQLKTGRDVVVGALLGAEEFGFATTVLVCLGCVMMRQCHSNTCPVGVATQDPELRKRFAGKPAFVINFLRFVAREVREHLAGLGLRSLDEACGRSDLLEMNRAISFYKARHLDFSAVFHAAGGEAVRFDPAWTKPPAADYDRAALLPRVRLDGTRQVLEGTVANVDRSVGTGLSGEIAARFGQAGLPEDTLRIRLRGVAGQSFGAFLAPGVTLELTGEANDYVGKGLSGGTIIIRPDPDAGFEAARNVVAGNVIGYGATSGRVFLNGLAGERFAIRNSGATLVVEGLGDHGCEYMTGGCVVVLGSVGVNFAAGMTGGIAYVLDVAGDFDLSCNVDSVDLETVEPGGEDEQTLRALIRAHHEATGSVRAEAVLTHWEDYRPRFVKLFPVEYRLALETLRRRKAAQ